MGMFDDIHIDINLLPLSEQEMELFTDEIKFQTKSLDNALSDYYITKEGLFEELYDLEREVGSTWNYRGKVFEVNIRTNKRLIKIEHHGFVQFYHQVGEEWFEFKAKFTDGKLVSIVRV